MSDELHLSRSADSGGFLQRIRAGDRQSDKVTSSNPLVAGQFPCLAALCCPRLSSWKLVYIAISLIKGSER